MLQLVILFRAMQMFSHSAHLLCARTVFFQDHEFFGSVYSQAEGYFDSISERMIGLGQEEQLKLQSVIAAVGQKLAAAPSIGVKENKEYYAFLMSQCDEACKLCDSLCKSGQFSEGTKQLLGGIADELEVLKYKISRRMK
jgi:DNA-binding ferritin-like protein